MSMATMIAGTALLPSKRVEARSAVLFDYVNAARKVETAQQFDALFRFRFDVFCRKLRFFDPAHHPDGRECDRYDRDALHFAKFDAEGQIVGGVRLILCRPFPLEGHCRLFADSPRLAELRVAEVSRLAVAPPSAGTDRLARQKTIVALCKAMILESKARGVTHWAAAMERSLHRVLTGLGCTFTPIGPEIDYSGPVRPYLAEVNRLWREQRMTYLH